MTRYLTAKQVAAILRELGALTGEGAVYTVWRWARAGRCAVKRLPGTRGRLLVGVDADGFPVPVTPRRR